MYYSMLKCSKCKEEKSDMDFYLRNKKYHLYQSTCKKCSNKMCRDRQHRKIEKFNRKPGGQRKYTLNENVFDSINECTVYWLGFLYADGYNYEKGKHIALSLAEEDQKHIEKFKNFLVTNKNINIYPPSRGGEQNMHSLVIYSGKLSNKLKELGCMQNKTFKIQFPTFLPDDMIRHFIRGYFDGDGSVGRYFNKNKNNYNCVISIVSNEQFLSELKIIIEKNCNINLYLYKNFNKGKSDVKSISSNGSFQVYKFLNWIYEDCTIYLDRKYSKYIEIKNWLLTRPYKKGQKSIK